MSINIFSCPPILNALPRSLQEEPWPCERSPEWRGRIPGRDTLQGSPFWVPGAPQTFAHSALELRAYAPHLAVGTPTLGSLSDLSTGASPSTNGPPPLDSSDPGLPDTLRGLPYVLFSPTQHAVLAGQSQPGATLATPALGLAQYISIMPPSCVPGNPQPRSGSHCHIQTAEG